MHCRELKGGGSQGLKLHCNSRHPQPPSRRNEAVICDPSIRKHRLEIGHNGLLYCAAGRAHHKRPVKRVYLTIEDAWRAAFVEGTLFGAVMTPYRCTANKTRFEQITVLPHPNPWAFDAFLILRRPRCWRQRFACGAFHLTTKARDFILSAPKD